MFIVNTLKNTHLSNEAEETRKQVNKKTWSKHEYELKANCIYVNIYYYRLWLIILLQRIC